MGIKHPENQMLYEVGIYLMYNWTYFACRYLYLPKTIITNFRVNSTNTSVCTWIIFINTKFPQRKQNPSALCNT